MWPSGWSVSLVTPQPDTKLASAWKCASSTMACISSDIDQLSWQSSLPCTSLCNARRTKPNVTMCVNYVTTAYIHVYSTFNLTITRLKLETATCSVLVSLACYDNSDKLLQHTVSYSGKTGQWSNLKLKLNKPTQSTLRRRRIMLIIIVTNNAIWNIKLKFTVLAVF